MIQLIRPSKIAKEKSLIDKFKNFGLDHLDINSILGWNYVLNHVWLYNNIKEYLFLRGNY